MTFKVPNDRRVKVGRYASDDSAGCNGLFFISNMRIKAPRDEVRILRVIASDGEGWEHVSVSLPHRTPTWKEMDFIKRMFWDDDDCVMQLHPPRGDWVNNHPYCLHLWRPVGDYIPRPPMWLVGYQSANVKEHAT